MLGIAHTADEDPLTDQQRQRAIVATKYDLPFPLLIEQLQLQLYRRQIGGYIEGDPWRN